MDNVNLKLGETFEQVSGVSSPKRIKFSELSRERIVSILNKMNGLNENQIVPETPSTKQDISNISQNVSQNVSHVSEENNVTALSNVNLLNVDSNYTPSSYVMIGTRAIRLTNGMYDVVYNGTADTRKDKVATINDSSIFSQNVEESAPDFGTSSIDSSEVQASVNNAFMGTESNSNNVDYELNSFDGVKKAPYSKTKAKVEKYDSSNVDKVLPKHVLSGDNIFSSPVSTVSDKDSIDNNNDRDVPLVVADRGDVMNVVQNVVDDPIDRFFFDTSTAVIENEEKDIELNTPEDMDISSILSEIKQLQQDDVAADHDNEKIAEELENSVQTLNASAEEVKKAKKNREEVIKRAILIRDTLSAEVAEKRDKIESCKAQIEENKAKIKENSKEAEALEKGTFELSQSIPDKILKKVA